MWNTVYKRLIFNCTFFECFGKTCANCGNLKPKVLIFSDVKISQNSSFGW